MPGVSILGVDCALWVSQSRVRSQVGHFNKLVPIFHKLRVRYLQSVIALVALVLRGQ